MKKMILIGALFLGLIGCAASPVEPDRYYRLAPLESTNSQFGEIVELRRIQAPGLLGGRALLIAERTDPIIAREVRGSLWVSPPNLWLTDMILKRGFDGIRLVGEGAPSQPRHRLNLKLDDLFIDMQNQQTAVGLSGTLVFNESVHRIGCHETAPLASNGAVESAAMDSYHSALSRCTADLNDQIIQVVR